VKGGAADAPPRLASPARQPRPKGKPSQLGGHTHLGNEVTITSTIARKVAFDSTMKRGYPGISGKSFLFQKAVMRREDREPSQRKGLCGASKGDHMRVEPRTNRHPRWASARMLLVQHVRMQELDCSKGKWKRMLRRCSVMACIRPVPRENRGQ
jgi:hypothetical protein